MFQGVYHVRGIEVGIVCLVLVVWVAAIALFFNRWGKIRMLLPYQPDYKDSQLKVPGTCQTTNHTTCQQNSTNPFCCSQVTPPYPLSHSSSLLDLTSTPPRSLINLIFVLYLNILSFVDSLSLSFSLNLIYLY